MSRGIRKDSGGKKKPHMGEGFHLRTGRDLSRNSVSTDRTLGLDRAQA